MKSYLHDVSDQTRIDLEMSKGTDGTTVVHVPGAIPDGFFLSVVPTINYDDLNTIVLVLAQEHDRAVENLKKARSNEEGFGPEDVMFLEPYTTDLARIKEQINQELKQIDGE